MNVVVRAALEALRVQLATVTGVPVRVGQRDATVDEVFPHVAIVTEGRRFRFDLSDDDVVASNGAAGTAVIDLGTWSGRIEIRAGHKTDPERNALEQLIQDAFFVGELDGALVVTTAPLTLGGAGSGYQAFASFDLEDVGDDDSRAKERVRFGGITVSCSVPLLVRRTGLYDIDELMLTLTTDTSPGETAVTESHLITEDGELA